MRPVTDMLEVKDLVAGYRGVAVVHELDIAVAAGEVVALLGPNGAGKTTTMQTVAGLLPKLGGEVRIDGRAVGHRRPHRMAAKGLGYVAEDRGLFAKLTVDQNLRLGLPRSARRGGNRKRLLAEIDDAFPALGPLAGRPAGLLSGGEQQMLAIARAMLAEPKILLIDEMSLGLAPLIVQSLLPVVRSVAERGAAVLLVEQHVPMALDVADRVIAMSRGRRELEVTVAEVHADRSIVENAYWGNTDRQ